MKCISIVEPGGRVLERLAETASNHDFGTPVEMEIFNRFCMLLPAA